MYILQYLQIIFSPSKALPEKQSFLLIGRNLYIFPSPKYQNQLTIQLYQNIQLLNGSVTLHYCLWIGSLSWVLPNRIKIKVLGGKFYAPTIWIISHLNNISVI